MPDILIVEDESDIRELLVYTLERAGFTVTETKDANSALVALRQSKKLPGIVLIDWMLPGMSGHELVSYLRADPRTKDLPLLMLTAKTEEADKLEAFTIGVDDYITKPFSVRELTARIHALLRRTGSGQGEPLQCGPMVLDLHSHQLCIDGEFVVLGPTEYKLLELFMRNPNRAYSRSQLLDRIWGRDACLEERTVDVHILRLRKTLTPAGLDKWVQTVRSVGYRFSPP